MRRWTCRCKPGPSLLGVAAILLVLAGGFLWMLGGTAPIASDRVGGSFALINGKGQSVSDRDFRGRYLLIYFGYTSCPDVCPTTLANMEAAVRALGAKGTQVQPIFITVDPQHDTPEIVRSYVASFGPDLVGLTGSVASIRAVQREYRIRSTAHRESFPERGRDRPYVGSHTGRPGRAFSGPPSGQLDRHGNHGPPCSRSWLNVQRRCFQEDRELGFRRPP